MMSLVHYTYHYVSSASIINRDSRQQGCPFLYPGQASFIRINGTTVTRSQRKKKDMRVLFPLFETSHVTLGESHNEDEVDGDESEQIAHDHPVNHHDERADRFEAPAEE